MDRGLRGAVLAGLAHAAVLLVIFGDALDNQIVNAYAPTRTDAFDYVRRAVLPPGGFVEAFRDGYRLPGYPVFLAVLDRTAPNPWQVARILQTLATSSLVPLTFVAVRRSTGSRRAWAAAGVVAAWPVIHYWAPILYTETLSLLTLAVLLLLLSRMETSGSDDLRIGLGVGVVMALATYLKPNQLLLWVPVAGVALLIRRNRAWRLLGLGVGACLLLLLPWSLFVSTANDRLIPLSTTQGLNLYIGAGLSGIAETEADTVHASVARALDLQGDPRDIPSPALPAAERDRIFQERALEAWRARPLALTAYGGAKALHALGLSLRGLRDAVLVAFSLLALAMSLFLWWRGRARRWCVFLWLATVVFVAESVVFLPNQRFRVVAFDLPAAIVLGIGIAALGERLLARWSGDRSGRRGQDGCPSLADGQRC